MGASTIEFHNSYSTVIFVAYFRLDYGCGEECGEPWDVRGWARLAPGDTQSRANPTKNGYYYYYAEAINGAFWSGPYVAEVTDSVFNKCTCLGVVQQNGGATNPYHDVGFRELNTNQYSSVNFTA